MSQSAFDRYGGFAAVSRIVSEFYDRVLDSPVLADYFQNSDMRTVIDHQTKFIASIMGGPASYTNDQLERVHANLGISEEAFDEAVALLRETFEDFDVDESDIALILQDVKGRRKFIVIP